MMYAQSLYSLQNKYQQAGIDGDVANDKIADAIRRRQIVMHIFMTMERISWTKRL